MGGQKHALRDSSHNFVFFWFRLSNKLYVWLEAVYFQNVVEEQNFFSECVLKKRASASGTRILTQLRSKRGHREFCKTSILKHQGLQTSQWTKYESTVRYSLKAIYQTVARMRAWNCNVTQVLTKAANRTFMWYALLWRWGKCWRSFFFLSKLFF